ncbi:hypothetical protein GCM10007968_09780 [Sporolactobacillus putidus]|uniref:Uncharacterized protein n=1 Tax=Sporolactobacillus putidus TaxID=492735 RepID=A0A917RZC3_9BACL|nr:hypothetical protein GCM10007968_09780 [Sporolactobacillus putidus]
MLFKNQELGLLKCVILWTAIIGPYRRHSGYSESYRSDEIIWLFPFITDAHKNPETVVLPFRDFVFFIYITKIRSHF